METRAPKIIELKQAPVVLVEIPTGWGNIEHISIGSGEMACSLCDPDTGEHYHVGTNLKELGILSDLTEDQFTECVEKINDKRYIRYTDFTRRFRTAKESFYSLLESEKVYTENPYGVKPHYTILNYGASPLGLKKFETDLQKWQEAQSKVWDKERTFLFIKVS